MSNYSHRVTEEEEREDLTINQILRRNFKFSSRFKTKIKFQKLVDLNGEQSPGYLRPKAGDEIVVRLPEETSDFPMEDIPVSPLYEDEDILIIDKQPGVTVHPTKGHPSHTLANGIMKYMHDTNQSFKIRFANRLDMDTSGIVIVAKNANSQNDISHQMRNQTTVKKYRAVVLGNVKEDFFTIDLPIGREGDSLLKRCPDPAGQAAHTHYEVLDTANGRALLRLTPTTGRTHQLRVHMAAIGCPLTGDWLYGTEDRTIIARPALHSYHLRLTHPVTGAVIDVTAPLPEDMVRLLKAGQG